MTSVGANRAAVRVYTPGYGNKGRKTFSGETRIEGLIYADRSGGSGKDGGVIGCY